MQASLFIRLNGALDEWLSQRSAKPSTAVRIRQAPQQKLPKPQQPKGFGFFVDINVETGDYDMEYMSQEGYDKLVAELRQLESVELPRVREAIAEARAQGDLSENFEYHAAKREQGRLLGRIRFKQRVLENARVLDTSLLQTDSIQLLSRVEMTNLTNQARMTYTIVNPHEANLREGKISIKSPIAQALLGKKVGDEVTVKVPAGLMKFRIESIEL